MYRTTLCVLAIAWHSYLWKDAAAFSVVHRSILHRVVNRKQSDTAASLVPTLSSRTKSNRRGAFQLFSLKPLVDEITQSVIDPSSGRKTIFVGGKGGYVGCIFLTKETKIVTLLVSGAIVLTSVYIFAFSFVNFTRSSVGKTTVSSSLAVELATNQDIKVWIVSTDPAHSLGDALDVDLRRGRGQPVVMTDPLTRGNLFASEVNAEEALEDFRESLASFDIDRLAQTLGIPIDLLEGLGLREFSGLLNNPPPGLDELVALGNVMDENKVNDYDVVIVDTAPTGHTLRLLALPQFLDGLLGKLIKLRMKLSGVASTLQAFFGNSGAQERKQSIDNALDRLDQFRVKIKNMEVALRDQSRTNFLVVTIPTKLAVAESKRLVADLTSQGIAVNDIVVNQCVTALSANDQNDGLIKYYERRRESQSQWVDKLRSAAADVSATEEYKSNGSPSPISVTEFPFFDVELVGVPALGYVGSQQIVGNPNFEHLMNNDNGSDGETKVVICGGKGGVGKTTTSSALAVSMAARGHKVALISTDPAHSLGDAIDMDISGGDLIDCPLIGVPGATGEGSLSVMEIDPSASLNQFKGIVDKLMGSSGDKSSGAGSDLRATLQDLEGIFDTLPAGTDEVVALAKVINLVKKGGFDRIVLDTAPTGHTLRMLGTPGFLAELIDRILEISRKINSNAAVKMFITSAASGQGATEEQMESATTIATSQLLGFQLQMYDLEDLFANPDQTEFLIVTVPTELAVRESVRLLNDLTFEAPDMPIKVRNIVANQVLKDDGSDVETFLTRLSNSQAGSITDLEQSMQALPNPPKITKVQYLDTEPRGVFGLKVLGDALLKED
jgi:arsenite-transporting ATPase